MIISIRPNITIATEIIRDPLALDAYTFAVMIKSTVVSGRIKNATQRRLCAILGIGTHKCKECLKNALRLGYVRYEGKDLIAVRLNRKGDYVGNKVSRQSRANGDDNIRCHYKFTQLKKLIRKDVIENHVAKQEDFCYTAECSVNPISKKQFDWARRRIKCMSKKDIAEHTDKLSITRVMEVAAVKRSTAKSLMRELVKEETLTKTANKEETNLDVQYQLQMSYTERGFKKSSHSLMMQIAKNINEGFPVMRWRWIDEYCCRLMVDIQYANSYSVKHSHIRRIS